MNHSTRVGVVDKTAAILDALELGPHSLAELATVTGIPRPSAHRLAVALEVHRLVARDSTGKFMLGSRIAELASATHSELLTLIARPVLAKLRDATGESVQLYRRQGNERICLAVAEPAMGLRDTVPVGARLTLNAGSAAQILAAWESGNSWTDQGALRFGPETLELVRSQGWAQSVAEREPGVASVSAPVHTSTGRVIAALSVSGPIDRIGQNPGAQYSQGVVNAADELTSALEAQVR